MKEKIITINILHSHAKHGNPKDVKEITGSPDLQSEDDNKKVPYSKVQKRIKKNLIKFRKEKNWTLDEASNYIGIKKSRLDLMEKGYELKSLYWLQKIARGYNVDIVALFK